MNDTEVTFHGYAGGDVRLRQAGGVDVATLRVATTPRLKRDGEWTDGETTWFSVTAWRALATHMAGSIRKGDPVIVHGRLRPETYTPAEGPTATTLSVEALLVGHDLTRGLSHYIRPQRAHSAEQSADRAGEEVGGRGERISDRAGAEERSDPAAAA